MSMPGGTRVGPYEIIAAIGAGGMGEVYRAHDPRLGRDVAIKVLPATFSADPDRLRRFEHEARAAATLNHPNILAVHDIGTHNSAPYLVSELLEGETLRDRLASGALPPRKAIDYSLQIARGLAAAHDRGIVHRDLKPENVFVTTDGRVKILDFGLAKALATYVPDARTIAGSQGTEVGTVLGTVGYMAPEQVRALAVDHRADIFAFGCVLYEMLGGQRAFSAATSADTMSAILTSEPPDLDLGTAAIPVALLRIVRRCLEKVPAQRFQSADDLAFALDTVTGAPTTTAPSRIVAPQPSRRRMMAAAALGILSLAATVGVAMFLITSRMPRDETMSFGLTVALTRDEGLELHPALSPDGSLVAYAAGPSDDMHVYVRQVAGGRAIDLTPSMTGSQPRWSPDGTRILFVSPAGVYVVPALGGVARKVVDRAVTAEWSPDGKEVAYTTDDRVSARAVDGSASRTVTESRESHSLAWSPDRRFLVFVAGNVSFIGPGRLVGNLAPSRLVIVPAAGGTAGVIASGNALNTSPAWMPDSRRLLFVSNAFGTRDVFELALTADGKRSGEPRRLTTGLSAHTITVSRDGRHVAYGTLTLSSNIWAIRVPDRPPISIREAVPVTSGVQIVEGLSVSRDGRWLAFDSNAGGNQNIYRMRLPDGEPEQVTTDPADEFEPSWSPDATRIAFQAWAGNNRDVYAIGADGRGRERLTSGADHEWFPSWSPDGTKIAFIDSNQNGVSVIRRTADGWSRPALVASVPRVPVFSPDGRELLLVGGPVDLGEVRIVPADGGAARVLFNGVLPGGTALASTGRWSPAGDRVYLFAVDQQGRSSIWSMPSQGGTPTLVVRFDDPSRESNRREFDTDGRHFYLTLARKQGDVWVMNVEGAGK